MSKVAIVHDYLTQRGGAERVVLAMVEAFPDAPIYTSLYEPKSTFPEFAELDVRPSRLNRYGFLRRNHRAALPFLAGTFERLVIDEGVVLASSSGWAHGVTAPQARKVVYCYTPARWLYLRDQYAVTASQRAAMRILGRRLERWDRAAAATADAYLANSTVVQARIKSVYGIDAAVLHSPHSVETGGDRHPVDGVEPGYFLVVSRLLPYKNVDAVVGAMAQLPAERLVIVGEGPERTRLEETATANVRFVGAVSDAELRWLYANSAAAVTAAYEDFGLVPIEAAAFGKPAVTLGAGGFVDTVLPGETGLFFPAPRSDLIARALKESLNVAWDESRLLRQARVFSKEVFIDRLRSAIAALTPRSS